MKLGVVREKDQEKRVALTPQNAKKLCSLGFEILIEQGFAESCCFADEDYNSKICNRQEVLKESDLLVFVNAPQDIINMKPGALALGYLDPFNNHNLILALAERSIDSFSIELIPRTTQAQKMDALSSQASIAGYCSVINAASRIQKIFPMMMTPSGTIKPAKVFVIGAGVAGLQAIATAKRLGAQVDAFDTRPVVEEQVRSLGANFVKVDLGETGQSEQGYAKELTKEQLSRQRELMAKHCAISDIVITTAQLFGKKAPIIITDEMIKGMKKGSIIVDLAIETGGNVEGAVLGQEIEKYGVKILGIANLPGKAAIDASEMYSNNLFSFIESFFDKEKKEFNLDEKDEIQKSCLLTYKGKIVNERFKHLELKR